MDRGLLGRAVKGRADRLPPHAYFAVSAVFHYLGPSFAVLLFPAVGVLGVAWFRIASAAAVFAPWTHPLRTWNRADRSTRLLLLSMGLCLAAMNSAFYLALDRLPMSLVASIEFVGTIAVAVVGMRSARNLAALGLAVGGVALLIDVTWYSDPVGLGWAFLNGGLFVLYIVLAHRVAQQGGGNGGITGLGAAMTIAFIAVLPFGLEEVLAVIGNPVLILAGIGVGICSSVVPYICDQLAMARLPRASFALLLSLLPATATVIGFLILAQVPSLRDLAGVALVMAGVALHKPAPSTS